LEELSGEKITDLHKHIVDKVVFKKDGKEFHRIPEVLDCWFESGSMPYAQTHYPFENKEKVERNYPAEFIAEGQDQTRGWFYTLHVLAAALTRSPNPAIPVDRGQPAFKNCIVNGIVLAEDGKKMSKRLKNYPEPDVLLEKFGADAMRYYLTVSPVMEAENLNFSEAGVKEAFNKLINTLWNVVEFYKLYAGSATKPVVSKNVLDKWIIAKLNRLVTDVTAGMEAYKLIDASRPIGEFVTELSQWYVRRSRDRFKGADEADKQAALSTLHHVLVTLSKVLAPFTPFIAERIYLDLGGKEESVHLDIWPTAEAVDETILKDMALTREVVERILFARSMVKIKVRQPLREVVLGSNYYINGDFCSIIQEETNVKKVNLLGATGIINISDKKWFQIRYFNDNMDETILLDTEITEELKNEGLVRELVRTINQMRKEMKLTVSDRVKITYSTESEVLKNIFNVFGEKTKAQVLASEISEGAGGIETEVDGEKIKIALVAEVK
jgi:isoleucyl-tRNA synthetase